MQGDSNGASASIEPRRVLELLSEQVERFATLETLAQRQQALVAGEAIEPLLAVLADRRRVSIRLAQISRLLEPVRRSWGEFRERLEQTDRARAEALVERAEQSLGRLIASDERDARILSARRRRIADLLSGLNSAGHARTAYQPALRESVRVDCVSEDA